MIQQTLQTSDLGANGTTSSRFQKIGCKGCGMVFVYNIPSISNPNRRNGKLFCTGCNKLFSLARPGNIYQRFNILDVSNEATIKHEAHLLQDEYLHLSIIPDIPQGIIEPRVYYLSSRIGLFGSELYHLPLSSNFYSKKIDETGHSEFIYQLSEAEKNTAHYYNSCHGCIEFVKAKRRTLKRANQKAAGGGVASFEQLMELLVSSNSTCVFTGVKGTWSSIPNDPLFSLSIDHNISLHAGGSSEIANLQITLQCLNNVKANYDSEEFLRWVEGIKNYKGAIDDVI